MNYVTEAQFSEEVLRSSFAYPVVVMFSAPWCAPCKALKPLVERLAAEMVFPLVGVDADQEKGLATFYGIRSVPTLAIFGSGKVIAQATGRNSEVQLREFFRAAQNPLGF